MSKHNIYLPYAQIAIERALERGMPMTPRSVHDIMTNDNDLLHAQIRSFNTEQGMAALRVQAVSAGLKDYGDAVGLGRDAEHVPEHTRQSMARRLSMLEQIAAQMIESRDAARNEYAQLSLADDLAEVTADAATKA